MVPGSDGAARGVPAHQCGDSLQSVWQTPPMVLQEKHFRGIGEPAGETDDSPRRASHPHQHDRVLQAHGQRRRRAHERHPQGRVDLPALHCPLSSKLTSDSV